MEHMETFRVTLLGRFRVEDGGAAPIQIHGSKAQELLCFLLLFREHPHTREKLAWALWQENASDHTKCYLRRTLWQLQQDIETHVDPWPPFLLVDSDWIQLNPEVPLLLDVAELEKAYKMVRGVQGDALDEDSADLLRQATRLYQGELLDGWYQTWCICERERLQHIYLVMLDKLMRYCEARGEIEAGIVYGQRILRIDRAREHTHRQLMRLACRAGDRTGALRQYECCRLALWDELGVEPTQKTKTLFQRIQQDRVDLAFPSQTGRKSIEATDQAQLPAILLEIEHIQADLACLSRRVSQAADLVSSLIAPDAD
jgi:DNA-binding SARP family transcriptional activator